MNRAASSSSTQNSVSPAIKQICNNMRQLCVRVVVAEVTNNMLIKDCCTKRAHSREAAGLADLALGNVLLQIADVSASSTSCCQWLSQSIPKKNNRVRVSSCNERNLVWMHSFYSLKVCYYENSFISMTKRTIFF